MAGFDAGSIVARVKADISDFKDGMEQAQHHSGRFHDGLGKVAGGVKLLAKGLAVGGAAAAAFGGIAMKEFSDSENAAAQLNAVLKSTGGIAGVTAESANELASSLERVTKFSDEAILGGENLLLTFTNIGKDIFPEATETMLDMSQALGQDVKASAVQLGKALQDPILGVTALRRVGVNFTESQQDMIAKLVQSGKTMEAQKFILKELKTEFGGSARAAGETFSGQLIIAKNTFSNFMETIGNGIVMKIAPLLQKFNEWIASVGGVDGALKVAQQTLMNVWNSIVNFLQPALNLLLAVWEFLRPSLVALAQTISNELWPALQRLWDVLGPILIPALKVLGAIIGAILVAAIWLLINVLNIVISVITTLIRWLSNLIQWGRNTAGALGDAFAWMRNTATSAFSAIWGWIQSIQNKFSEIVGSIKKSLGGVWDAITGPFRSAFDWVGDRVEGIKNKLKSLNPFQRHSPSLYDLVSKGTEAIRNQYADMFGSIGNMADKFGAISLAPALAGQGGPQDNRVNTQIYGNINIGSNVDADNFMTRLTRNQELVTRGLTPR